MNRMKRTIAVAALALLTLTGSRADRKSPRVVYAGEDVSVAGAPATPFSVRFSSPKIWLSYDEDGNVTVYMGGMIPDFGVRVKHVTIMK